MFRCLGSLGTMGWIVSRVRMPRPSGSLRVPTSPLLPSSPSFASLRLLVVLGPSLAQSPPLFCHFPHVVTDLEPSLSAPFGRRDNARPAVFAPLQSPSKRFTACGPGASSLIFFAFLRLHSAPRYPWPVCGLHSFFFTHVPCVATGLVPPLHAPSTSPVNF